MKKKKDENVNKEKPGNFVLTLPLKTEIWHEHILDQKLKVFKELYNYLVSRIMKRYNLMVNTEEYKNIKKLYKEGKENKDKNKLSQCKELYKKIYEKYEIGLSGKSSVYGITQENAFYNRPIASLRNKNKYYQKYITAVNLGVIQKRIVSGMEKVLYSDAKKLYFLKWNDLYTYRNQGNVKGEIAGDLIIMGNNLYVSTGQGKQKKEFYIPLIIKTEYEKKCLSSYKQRNVSIFYKFIGSKKRYFVQVCYEGVPPMRNNKIKLGKGTVGMDIGTQTLAYSSNQSVGLIELADKVTSYDKKIKNINRYLDRSRRATNPNKFNEDGTIKKGNKEKWIKSNRYKKQLFIKNNLQRKQTYIRKLCHFELIKQLIPQGDIFLVENMNFKGLQKRNKKTEVSEKTGKIKKKKRFGKSLANKAPSMFLMMLKNKLNFLKGFYQEVNTKELKASQFNHLNGEYNKKKLSQRWNNLEVNGEVKKVQRDLYSAYLIQNAMVAVNESKKEKWIYDIENCNKNFDNFLILHDKEIERLKEANINKKLNGSMGINTKMSMCNSVKNIGDRQKECSLKI